MQVSERVEAIQTALDKLGDRADEVADSLELLGITGLLGCSCHCPIAKYLKKTVPDIPTNMEVYSSQVSWPMKDTGETFLITVARPIWEFVHLFDQRRYPKLIEEERHCLSPSKV